MKISVDSNDYPNLYLNNAVCNLGNTVCATSQPTYYCSYIYYPSDSKIDLLYSIRFAKLHNNPINLTKEEVEKCLDKDPTIFDGVKLNIVNT